MRVSTSFAWRQHISREPSGRFLFVPDRSIDPRVRFSQTVLPAREALLRNVDELQAINRSAFIRYQHDLDARSSAAERWTWQQLGLALVVGLGIAVLAIVYAGRLETRLKAEIDKDAQKYRSSAATVTADLSLRKRTRGSELRVSCMTRSARP